MAESERIPALFDTHAHLYFDADTDDPEGDISRAAGAGVAYIAAVGTDRATNRATLDSAVKNEKIYAILGIHPHEADRCTDDDFADLSVLAGHSKAVAVGETGLDYYRDYADRANQKKLFERHIDLARNLDKPLILHIREAHGDGLAILRGHFPGGYHGIAHCFGGDAHEAAEYLDLGFTISIPGTVTYKKADKLREVVRSVPLSNLVVETDCPYLSPEPMRGKRNEPAYVKYTAEKIAELKGVSFEETAQATTENALRVFRIER